MRARQPQAADLPRATARRGSRVRVDSRPGPQAGRSRGRDRRLFVEPQLRADPEGRRSRRPVRRPRRRGGRRGSRAARASPTPPCCWRPPADWERLRSGPWSSRMPRPAWKRAATAGSRSSSASTGPGHAEELRRHGADVVVPDLADVAVRTGDKRMSQLPNALDSYGQLIGVVGGRQPFVCLDFDGTLSEIVSDPDAAMLVDGAAKALENLAAQCPVAILSGRDLADIRDRVGLPGIWYAGSHGFELIGPDGKSPPQRRGSRRGTRPGERSGRTARCARRRSREYVSNTSAMPSRSTTAMSRPTAWPKSSRQPTGTGSDMDCG